jgi:serine/threonine-protein kinase
MDAPGREGSLGQIALARGWVRQEQLEAAAKLQEEALGRGEKLRLGEALVRLGALNEEQVRQALGAQDKQSFRCPACNKTFNVRGLKPGVRIHCKSCNGVLEPVAAPPLGPVSDTNAAELRRSPVGKEVDPALVDRVPGYTIERRLGSGGMGDVYLARQASLDRLVAVKILPAELAKDAGYAARFLSEARSAAKVTHENIVASVDAGETNGTYFFIMEYVDGETVAQLLKREGPLPEKRALEIARHIARGLQYAHQQGLIHRDIKPANVMLNRNGTAKILDFGLARAIGEVDALAAKGMIQSSPAYASPEQAKGKADLDHRTDMYSLGITLFEMLTGKRPFEAPDSRKLLVKHVEEAPPAPKAVNPAVTLLASNLVLRLLRKEPEQRFASYEELLAALDKMLDAKAARTAAAAAPPPPDPRALHIKIGASAAAVVVLGLGWMLMGGKEPEKVVETRPKNPAPPKIPAEVAEALREAREIQERSGNRPENYPGLREHWRKLEAKYRETPHHATFAAALVQFESRVQEEAQTASRQFLQIAEAQEASGKLADAVLGLNSFPQGFAGTDAAARIETARARLERALGDRFASERDEALKLVDAGKVDDARERHAKLQELAAADGRFAVPRHAEELAVLLRKIDAGVKPKTPAPDPGAPDPAASALVPSPKPPDRPSPAELPAEYAVLRSAELRSQPEARRSAAAAFARIADRCAINRAAQVFLSRDDRSWKLAVDRLQLKTPQVSYENLDGVAATDEKEGVRFTAFNGTKVLLMKDERVSVNGGAPVKPLKAELQRGAKTAFAAALDKYLASIPIERGATITPEQHHVAVLDLGRIVNGAGDGPVEAFQLFAAAHVEDLLAREVRLDGEVLKLVRFQMAKGFDLWGPPATLSRIALARLLATPGTPQELRRALDAAGPVPADWQTRLLVSLAPFLENTVDPRAVSENFAKLARLVPAESAVSRFCELVAQTAKGAVNCAECKAVGRVLCKTCTATGLAACAPCKGSGRVPERETPAGFTSLYTVPCRPCKSKGKVLCPTCQGALKAKCGACDGKKVRSAVPAADFASALGDSLCISCQGTGSLFSKVAYPCSDCDATGRFPASGKTLQSASQPAPAPRSPAPAAAEDRPVGGDNGLRCQYWETNVGRLATFAFPETPHNDVATVGFELSARRRNEQYIMRFSGFIQIPKDGEYTFTTFSDDGSMLYIGGAPVVDNDGLHMPKEESGKVTLKAGKHPLRVEFSQGGGGATLEVYWEGPGLPRQPIPSTALFRR